ncbi:hypothetical protein O181_126317 [Austropuccinia psidii MF-1]|uniref:Uncharacterized protein n=1 Tax=Austropuccinia psidii MF-1 TaxID=1389203 RepID=A0A9Q3KT59_9BASI|nr:hypothetical protein [Austropuccinia psidii MF-1]
MAIYMSHFKKYYTVSKDKDWEMLPQIPQGVISSWNILEKFLNEEIVIYSNGWNPLSSKPQIKNIKYWHNKNSEESKKEAPEVSASKPPASQTPQEGKKKENNWRKLYPPGERIPRIQNDSMDNIFNIARTLLEFNNKEENLMRQPHFPKK